MAEVDAAKMQVSPESIWWSELKHVSRVSLQDRTLLRSRIEGKCPVALASCWQSFKVRLLNDGMERQPTGLRCEAGQNERTRSENIAGSSPVSPAFLKQQNNNMAKFKVTFKNYPNGDVIPAKEIEAEYFNSPFRDSCGGKDVYEFFTGQREQYSEKNNPLIVASIPAENVLMVEKIG